MGFLVALKTFPRASGSQCALGHGGVRLRVCQALSHLVTRPSVNDLLSEQTSFQTSLPLKSLEHHKKTLSSFFILLIRGCIKVRYHD